MLLLPLGVENPDVSSFAFETLVRPALGVNFLAMFVLYSARDGAESSSVTTWRTSGPNMGLYLTLTPLASLLRPPLQMSLHVHGCAAM